MFLPPSTPAPLPAGAPVKALLLAARGFSCLFWGIPISLLFMVDAIQIEVIRALRLPTVFFGVLVINFGFLHLYRAAPLGRKWAHWAGPGLLLSLFLLYFTPFYYWWQRSPFAPFFIINMLGLLLVAAKLLHVVNRLSAEAGRLLGDPTLYIEARMCAWISLLLMLPLVLLAIGFALQSVAWIDSAWLADWIQARTPPPMWAFLCLLLPVALTMTSSWKAKERCLFSMLQAARPPSHR